MPDQILIGKFPKGLSKYYEPFAIDNGSFPYMFNAYVWRGQNRKKRGTSLLNRLERQVESVLDSEPPESWQYGQLTLVADAGNLITGYSIDSDDPQASIVPGSVEMTDGVDTWTDPDEDGTLQKNGGADPGSTINYATGAVVFTGAGVGPMYGTFSYYPARPVLGLRDFVDNQGNQRYPFLLAFDDRYSYQVNQTAADFFYGVNYYKGTNNPVVWSGQDFQQFWTVNFQSALWATNGKAGFHFVSATYVSGTGTTDITFDFISAGNPYEDLIVGDELFFNEWDSATNLNGLVGTVITLTDPANGRYEVQFDATQTVTSTGIAQLLTNSISGQDGIRWYDGDPTNRTGLPTGTGLGWVNFAPPLFEGTNEVSINDQTPGRYYLVGAKAIVPFKDRLLFFGPQIQTSTGSVVSRPLQDTVIFSWDGTPYYANVPTGLGVFETSDPTGYQVDVTGKGGWQSAGLAKPALTFVVSDDVVLVGFGGTGERSRLVYTSNDIQPFLFYTTNTEFPASSTFSGIPYEQGNVDYGQRGITYSTQQGTERIDMDIPDEAFKIQTLNNGVQRVNAVRDYYRQWIYFTYPSGSGNEDASSWIFPNQTFLWNYAENTWGIFRENYTSQGFFRKRTNYTWRTLPFATWRAWRQSWASGTHQAFYPTIVVGTPQGYVLTRDEGTNEGISGDIQAIADDGNGLTQITSVNHCVNAGDTGTKGLGDYLYFSNAIGSTYLNGQIGLVTNTIDADNFVVDIPFESGTYLGLGNFSRLTQPFVQTKQFQPYWNEGRKVRLCVQKYLFNYTANSEVTVNIYLSQDEDSVWNQGPIHPDVNTNNSALIYSQTVYTCPESTNLGLTPANVNLQMPIAETSKQIWHRMNTSLIGDTVQLGITLSDSQMRNLDFATAEITFHAIQLIFEKGPLLS